MKDSSQETLSALVQHIKDDFKIELGTQSRAAFEALFSMIREHSGIPCAPNNFPPVEVHPGLLQDFRRVTPHLPGLEWRSPEQAQVLQLLISGQKGYTLHVSPTGSGKSQLVIGAASMRPNKLVIVSTPFIATTEDLYRRLQLSGLSCASWDVDCKSTAPISPECSILVISAHHVNSIRFKTYLKCASDRILAIILDEAHELCISGYRNTFEYFHYLVSMNLPLFFFTATLLPRSEVALCHKLAIDPRLLRVLRVDSSRPNISYRVERYQDKSRAIDRVGKLLETCSLAAKERGLIFCLTKKDVEFVAARFNLPHYHATLDADEVRNSSLKTERHRAWLDAETPSERWMVCTLAFGLGIDAPHVRYTLHLEIESLLRYLQESGRNGRDGLRSVSFILTFPRYQHAPSVEDEHLGVAEARQLLETVHCRRLVTGLFDGVKRYSCGALNDAELCDNCEKELQVRPFGAVPKHSLTSNAHSVHFKVFSSHSTHTIPLRRALSSLPKLMRRVW